MSPIDRVRNLLITRGYRLFDNDDIEAVLTAAQDEQTAITWPEHVRLVHRAQDKALESLQETDATDAAYDEGYAAALADIARLSEADNKSAG